MRFGQYFKAAIGQAGCRLVIQPSQMFFVVAAELAPSKSIAAKPSPYPPRRRLLVEQIVAQRKAEHTYHYPSLLSRADPELLHRNATQSLIEPHVPGFPNQAICPNTRSR